MLSLTRQVPFQRTGLSKVYIFSTECSHQLGLDDCKGIIMRTSGFLCLSGSLSSITITSAEERLFWFTTDPAVKRNINVPVILPEGKEENRVLPWVFHNNEDSKLMQLKCIMRGYNASNNPSDYKNARWSHPGFSDSQVNTNAPAETGIDQVLLMRARGGQPVNSSKEIFH